MKSAAVVAKVPRAGRIIRRVPDLLEWADDTMARTGERPDAVQLPWSQRDALLIDLEAHGVFPTVAWNTFTSHGRIAICGITVLEAPLLKR